MCCLGVDFLIKVFFKYWNEFFMKNMKLRWRFFLFSFFQLSEIAILARKHSPWLAWLVWWKCLYDGWVIWFFIFKTFGDFFYKKIMICLVTSQNMPWSLIWHCVLDWPKKFKCSKHPISKVSWGEICATWLVRELNPSTTHYHTLLAKTTQNKHKHHT